MGFVSFAVEVHCVWVWLGSGMSRGSLPPIMRGGKYKVLGAESGYFGQWGRCKDAPGLGGVVQAIRGETD